MALLLLAAAVLPFFVHGQTPVTYSSLGLLPPDPLSTALDWLLKVITAGVFVAIALGIAGLHRSEERIERIGQGAQMVMLIDSSGSMDRPFVSGNEGRSRAAVWGTYVSKGQIARQLLARYVAQRERDMFAMFAFSRNPIAVHPLTEKQAVVQAAIAAGSIERGLATTDLGSGLIRAFEFFEDKPFTGSRIVMLLSDGAATLTVPIQDEIEYLMKKHRVTLYWIYLRDQASPGLYTEMNAVRAENIAPEQLVHKFFSELDLPYRAFSAENPAALENAIGEVDKLQNLPIRYTDIIPKRDLSGWCYAAALSLLLILCGAKLGEVQRW
jgi:mxaC protein